VQPRPWVRIPPPPPRPKIGVVQPQSRPADSTRTEPADRPDSPKPPSQAADRQSRGPSHGSRVASLRTVRVPALGGLPAGTAAGRSQGAGAVPAQTKAPPVERRSSVRSAEKRDEAGTAAAAVLPWIRPRAWRGRRCSKYAEVRRPDRRFLPRLTGPSAQSSRPDTLRAWPGDVRSAQTGRARSPRRLTARQGRARVRLSAFGRRHRGCARLVGASRRCSVRTARPSSPPAEAVV
jgi:hypothetical protein